MRVIQKQYTSFSIAGIERMWVHDVNEIRGLDMLFFHSVLYLCCTKCFLGSIARCTQYWYIWESQQVLHKSVAGQKTESKTDLICITIQTKLCIWRWNRASTPVRCVAALRVAKAHLLQKEFVAWVDREKLARGGVLRQLSDVLVYQPQLGTRAH